MINSNRDSKLSNPYSHETINNEQEAIEKYKNIVKQLEQDLFQKQVLLSQLAPDYNKNQQQENTQNHSFVDISRLDTNHHTPQVELCEDENIYIENEQHHQKYQQQIEALKCELQKVQNKLNSTENDKLSLFLENMSLQTDMIEMNKQISKKNQQIQVLQFQKNNCSPIKKDKQLEQECILSLASDISIQSNDEQEEELQRQINDLQEKCDENKIMINRNQEIFNEKLYILQEQIDQLFDITNTKKQQQIDKLQQDQMHLSAQVIKSNSIQQNKVNIYYQHSLILQARLENNSSEFQYAEISGIESLDSNKQHISPYKECISTNRVFSLYSEDSQYNPTENQEILSIKNENISIISNQSSPSPKKKPNPNIQIIGSKSKNLQEDQELEIIKENLESRNTITEKNGDENIRFTTNFQNLDTQQENFVFVEEQKENKNDDKRNKCCCAIY